MNLTYQFPGVGKTLLATVILSTLITGCNKRSEVDPSVASTTEATTVDTAPNPTIASSGSTASGSTASGMTLNDSQIEGILMAANTAEINAARVAENRSANATIKNYASKMITHHEGVNKDVAALSKKLNISPEQSEIPKTLKADADKEASNLTAATGTTFDKLYIDGQVSDHEKVLQTIDETLIPNAKGADLTQLLKNVRPTVSEHLVQAKTIQASLK
jgi:putative membrane protein